MKSKWVMVTGACINTGVDIVNKFAENNYNVIFTGRNSEKVKYTEKNYRQNFPNCKITGVCLESIDEKKEVNTKSVDELFSDFDKKRIIIDCLVLNAADQGLGMSIFDDDFNKFKDVINTNVLWNYYIIEQACLRMKKYGGGNVVFINSNTAYRAIPDRIAYSTTKSAQLGMMRALALDLGKYNIRVNAVLPGMIRTDRWIKNPEFYNNVPSRFTPLGDVATGKDIADAVWYFAEHAKNTTGAELVVDGGNTIQLYPVVKKGDF